MPESISTKPKVTSSVSELNEVFFNGFSQTKHHFIWEIRFHTYCWSSWRSKFPPAWSKCKLSLKKIDDTCSCTRGKNRRQGVRQIIVIMKAYFQMKSPKVAIALAEEPTSGKVDKGGDSWGYLERKIDPKSWEHSET